jgi:hypothetical protein
MSYITPTILPQVRGVVNETVSSLIYYDTDVPNLPVQDFVAPNNPYWLSDSDGTSANQTIDGLTVNDYLNVNTQANISSMSSIVINGRILANKTPSGLGNRPSIVATDGLGRILTQVVGNDGDELNGLCDVGDASLIYYSTNYGFADMGLVLGPLTNGIDAGMRLDADGNVKVAGNISTTGTFVAYNANVSSINCISTIETSSIITDIAATSSITASTITTDATGFVSTGAINISSINSAINLENSYWKFNGVDVGFGEYGVIGGGYQWPGGNANPNISGPRYFNTTNYGGAGVPTDSVRSSVFFSESPGSAVLITGSGGSYNYTLPVSGVYTITVQSANVWGSCRVFYFSTRATNIVTDFAYGVVFTSPSMGVVNIQNNGAALAIFYTHCISSPGLSS